MTANDLSNDPSDTLRRAWQGQRPPETPPTLDDVRRRAQQFSRRIRWRNAREYVAGTVVMLWILTDMVRGGFNGLADVGGLVIIAGVGYVLRQLYRRGQTDTLRSDLGMVDALSFHRSELVRQRDLVMSVWRWYLLPLLPGTVLVSLGRAIEHPERWGRALGTSVGMAALLALVAWLNRRAGTRLQRDIAALDDYAAGAQRSLDEPVRPSTAELLIVWTVRAFGFASLPFAIGAVLGVIPSGEPLNLGAASWTVRIWLPAVTVVGVFVQAAWWWIRRRGGRP